MKTSKTTQQLVRVFNTVADGNWHTLQGIAYRVSAPTQSVSARLRDLRKKKFGAYKIERVQRGTAFAYRLSI